MIPKFNKKAVSIILGVFVALSVAVPGFAQNYASLNGLNSLKAIFDFREGSPATAFAHLSLAYQSYKDDAVREVTESPQFVVVFMGSSVKLLSSEREEFSESEKKTLQRMDDIISKMIKEGMRLEVCLVAVNVFGVDPETISPKIERVSNGWISSIGYQAQGYSLVPVY